MHIIHTLTLVVGAHPLLRLGIVTLLKAHGMAVCGETCVAAVARRLCADRKPGLIVTDLDLAEGFGLVRDFSKLHPEALILALSEQENREWLVRAFGAGAHGYLSKFDEMEDLPSGLTTIAQGKRFVGRRMADLLLQTTVEGGKNSPARGVESLSDRELEVFLLIGQGCGATEQATILNRNLKTIETHHLRIRKKLDLRDSAELKLRAAQWIARNGYDGGTARERTKKKSSP